MFDRYYMKMALALAEKGAGFTSPNPMVGAVIAKDGKVIGRGWHRKVGEDHAEIHAIDDAGTDASGATLYVTLEPCNHTGRTPPCTHKILDAGIAEVVVAMRDPNPNVAGGGIDFLKANGIPVTCGICTAEAIKLNESFIKHSRTNRPFVTLKCASTLDGRIATKSGDSKWITNPKSRQFVHRLRHQVDAIMVGVGTVMTDDPSLTTRIDDFEGKDPTRVILDTKLSLPGTAKILRLDSAAETLIVAGDSAPESKKTELEQKGATVIRAAEKNGRIDLDRLMDTLGRMGITSLLLEGGSRVSASALAENIVDKIILFYAPKLLGGDDGVPIFSGSGAALMADCIPIKEMSIKRFDDDVMIEGYTVQACLQGS